MAAVILEATPKRDSTSVIVRVNSAGDRGLVTVPNDETIVYPNPIKYNNNIQPVPINAHIN